MDLVIAAVVFGAFVVFLLVFSPLSRDVRRYHKPTTLESSRGRPIQPKPKWVAPEVLRLTALLGHEASCRKVAAVFNQLHGAKRGITVGKTFVAETTRANGIEILRLRRELKHRVPRPLPVGAIWGVDLTYIPNAEERSTPVLGAIDHGTRACVLLRELRTKTTVAVLRALLDAIDRYGAPRAIRTDNESTFRSWLFRLALWLLDVRRQLTAPLCPWQNGRIERFFSTFKDKIRGWHAEAGVPAVLQRDLDLMRHWYNHVRPHQHLGYLTPAQAWTGRRPNPRRDPLFVSDWGERLTGFWWRN